MMLYKNCKSKIVTRSVIRDGKTYFQKTITIPATIWQDSQFPFNDVQEILVTLDIKNKRLIIEEIKDTETQS